MQKIQIVFSIFAGIILLNGVYSELETKVTFFTIASLSNTMDKQGWTVTGNSGQDLVSNCAGNIMFGGVYRFGSITEVTRTFNNLPSHTSIKISGKYHILDCGEKGKQWYVKIDGTTVFTKDVFHWNAQFDQVCGDTRSTCGDEVNLPLDIAVPHNANSVTITFTTNNWNYPEVESWGLNDISIELGGIPTPQIPTTTTTTNNNGIVQTFMSFTEDSLSNTADRQGWAVSGNQGPDLVSNCGGTIMFGGLSRFGGNTAVSRSFNNIPAHTSIRIQGKYHLMDCLELGKEWYVQIDGTTVFTRDAQHWGKAGFRQICGDIRDGCGDEVNIPLDITVPHTANQATVTFTTNNWNIPTDESWGLNDIQIDFISLTTTTTNTPTTNYNGKVVQDGACVQTCNDGYVVLNGVCKPSCPDNLVNDNGVCRDICRLKAGQVARQINGKWICVIACSDVEVLYDGKCLPKCPASFVNDHGVCNKQCTKQGEVLDSTTCRAQCSLGSQVNNSGICSDTCTNGLVNNKGNCTLQCETGLFNDTFTCKPQCAGTNAFYNGQVCVPSCPVPLLTEDFKCVAQCTPPKVRDGSICKDSCGDTYEDVFGKTYKKSVFKKNKKHKKYRIYKKLIN